MVKNSRPQIVCMCGSVRFRQAWIWENARLANEGYIVLSVGLWGHHNGGGNPLGVELTDERKAFHDELHKRKIDIADWVWVLDVGGYIGSSTRSEIEYANAHGKPVRYLSKEFPDYVEPADPLAAALTRAEKAESERDESRKRVAELDTKVRSITERGAIESSCAHFAEREVERLRAVITAQESEADKLREALKGCA